MEQLHQAERYWSIWHDADTRFQPAVRALQHFVSAWDTLEQKPRDKTLLLAVSEAREVLDGLSRA